MFNIERSHAGIVSKATMFKVLKHLDREQVRTPVLLLDREKVREKAGMIGSGVRNSRVFYAVKANPDLETLRFINTLGLGFEIASGGELRMLGLIGVEPDRIISSNPVKPHSFVEEAAAYGVRHFAFDSAEEVDKMAALAPGSSVYIRLSVPNEGSEWPLSRKFGAEVDQALGLMSRAAGKGLDVCGITFHVGSQCLNMFNWDTAVYKARALWEAAGREGLGLRMLNIGGGYPIKYTKNVVSVENIEKNVDRLIRENFPPEAEVFIEPGRAVVGDAGVLVASVIGKARRVDEQWLYIDVGVFNGLMESLGGIRYSYLVEVSAGKGRTVNYTVAGPSCDSFDVLDRDVPLPEPEVGSLLLIPSSGAYTVSYASEFNGFSIPRTILI